VSIRRPACQRCILRRSFPPVQNSGVSFSTPSRLRAPFRRMTSRTGPGREMTIEMSEMDVRDFTRTGDPERTLDPRERSGTIHAVWGDQFEATESWSVSYDEQASRMLKYFRC